LIQKLGPLVSIEVFIQQHQVVFSFGHPRQGVAHRSLRLNLNRAAACDFIQNLLDRAAGAFSLADQQEMKLVSA
jgi:hypothetical protein